MNSRARVGALVVCTTLVASGGSAFLAGCGGDDTIVDAGSDAEAGLKDSGPDTSDVNTIDVGADVLPDTAPVDAGACDASEISQFAANMITTLCGRYSTCCFADAATFDEKACEKLANGAGGWEGASRALTPSTLARCNLQFDPTAATSCLAGLKTFSCPAIAANEYSNTTQNCYGAVTGRLALNQTGCVDDVECVKGTFCAPAKDGGSSCLAIPAQGATCDKIDGVVVNSNDVCANRGYVDRKLYCQRFVADGGVPSNQCLTPLANGSPCVANFDCASGLCDDNSKCGGFATITDPQNVCPLFKKDGG